MVKTEVEKGRGFGTKWVWVMVALIGAFVAFAMSSKTSPKIAIFRAIERACQCAKGAPKYSGMVEDYCCDYETMDHLNKEVLNPSLQELVKTKFLWYFKVCLLSFFMSTFGIDWHPLLCC